MVCPGSQCKKGPMIISNSITIGTSMPKDSETYTVSEYGIPSSIYINLQVKLMRITIYVQ